ncbi:hypothetical protein B0H17DRAFT_1076481 [Mycena rosella]|uniref:SAM domain-containing protein n=1 Tax=Mycena rosella TaxID=1033263 RepID=A0AAD7D677_MYCRO|nr:hypothetical protein B0H17DRAFT_1076481 [Mycena rosella]
MFFDAAGPESAMSKSRNGKTISVPKLNLDDFCQTFGISEDIESRLRAAEFKSAGALLEISETDLKEVGLKIGQIGELRRALREFLSREMRSVSVETSQ